MLFVGRILDGITGGNISTAQAYIADITTEENRAKGMGLIGAAGLGSFWTGDRRHPEPLGHSGAVYLRRSPLLRECDAALFHAARDSHAGSSREELAARGRSLRQVMLSLKQPRLAFVLVIYFLFIVAFSIMTTAFSLYTMFRFGYDAQHTGYLFAYVGLIAVIIQVG